MVEKQQKENIEQPEVQANVDQQKPLIHINNLFESLRDSYYEQGEMGTYIDVITNLRKEYSLDRATREAVLDHIANQREAAIIGTTSRKILEVYNDFDEFDLETRTASRSSILSYLHNDNDDWDKLLLQLSVGLEFHSSKQNPYPAGSLQKILQLASSATSLSIRNYKFSNPDLLTLASHLKTGGLFKLELGKTPLTELQLEELFTGLDEKTTFKSLQLADTDFNENVFNILLKQGQLKDTTAIDFSNTPLSPNLFRTLSQHPEFCKKLKWIAIGPNFEIDLDQGYAPEDPDLTFLSENLSKFNPNLEIYVESDDFLTYLEDIHPQIAELC